MRCTRWRPVSDFRTYFSDKRGREYLTQVCLPCIKLRHKDRYRNFTPDQRRRFRERTREYAAARRRREGRPVRNMIVPKLGANRATDRLFIPVPFDPIEQEMKARRVTLEALAMMSGISDRRLRDWKKGKHYPTLDTLDRVCLALDSTIALLYPDLL